MPTAPTLISYTETAWNTGQGGPGSKTSASISWQTGDVIVVICAVEGVATLGVPTATGLTFASLQYNQASGCCDTRASYVVAGSSSSGTVNVVCGDGVEFFGFGIWVWRGSAGIGNSVEQHTATKTKALTPTGADSAICWGAFDWGASSTLGTIVPTPTNTRQRAALTQYTIYVAELSDQSSAGAVSYGISGSTGVGPWSILAVEVTGAASSFHAAPIRPSRQAVQRAAVR